MVPLRHWMTEHGHPGWYSWLVVVGGCLVSMIISVTISIQAAENSLQRDRQQRADQQAQSLLVACEVIVRMRDAYERQENLTQAGRDVAKAWADMVKLYQCT
jgi:heme exporter protein D